MGNAPISFEKLTCYYGKHKAVDTLSLDVPEGEVFALLVRNGAGKSSAIRCLLGFQAPTRGRTRVLGYDSRDLPARERGRIGYVAEGQKLIGWMRVKDLIAFQKATFPTFDAELCRSTIQRLGLPEKRRVFQLSRGMRAQLALALALAPRPELMILDDPAMGLDTVVRREFLEVMIDLIQEQGRTVLFTSHILTDVERVADRIAILDHGVLRVNAPVEDFKQRVRRWRATFDGDAPAPPSIDGLVRARKQNDTLLLTVVDGNGTVAAACEALGARHVEPEMLSLEDLFIEYTSGSGGNS